MAVNVSTATPSMYPLSYYTNAGLDPSTFTYNPDATITFTSGPHAGLKAIPGTSGPLLLHADGATGEDLSGPNMGKSVGVGTEPGWQKGLDAVANYGVPALASIVTGGLVRSGFGGNGSPSSGDSGPTSGAYSADPSGNVEPNGLSPYTPSTPGAPSNLLPNLAKFGAGLTGVGLAATANNPATQANAPLQAAMMQLIPLLTQRVQASQPLYQNAVNMAHGMLPKAYQ